MASLESLSNPLEALNVLPSAMNLRQRITGSGPTPVWDANFQYTTNDVVLSSLNGAAYIYTGDDAAAVPALTGPKSGILGPAAPGGDPSLDSTGGWRSFAPAGIWAVEVIVPTIAASVAPNFVFTAPTNVLDVTGGSSWLISWTGTFTAPAALVAADSSALTLTPSVGTALSWDIVPNADTVATATRASGTGVITVGGAAGSAQTLTLSGTYRGAGDITPSALRFTLQPVV